MREIQVEIQGSRAPIDTVPQGAPQIGTPEFRSFAQTPEWMEMRHEQALQDDELWKIDPRLVIREKYFENNDEPRSPYFAPRRLGATALCDPQVWSRDFRDNLPIDDPMRMDYEEEIYGKSEAELMAEDVESLGIVHEASIRLVPSDLVR